VDKGGSEGVVMGENVEVGDGDFVGLLVSVGVTGTRVGNAVGVCLARVAQAASKQLVRIK
jgi:hypothetical protein